MARKKARDQGRDKPILWKRNEINMKNVNVICGIHTVRLRIPLEAREIKNWKNKRVYEFKIINEGDGTLLRVSQLQYNRSQLAVGQISVRYSYNKGRWLLMSFEAGKGQNQLTDVLPFHSWHQSWPRIIKAMSSEIGVDLLERQIYLSRIDVAFDVFYEDPGLFIDSIAQLPKDYRSLRIETYYPQQSAMSRSRGESKAVSYYNRTKTVKVKKVVRIELRATKGRAVNRAMNIDRKAGDKAKVTHLEEKEHVDEMVYRMLKQSALFPGVEIVPHLLAKARVRKWPDSNDKRYVMRRLKDKYNLVVGSHSLRTASIKHLHERLMSAYEESWKK
ncbi:MAG: hypothetical protein NWF07_09880 [Candidatus Bathyarchaeota archaeon]|nr:hypothetical protein [Candidatus Bathyarchaeota archaeon]